MKPGDKVKHERYGSGKVTAVWPKKNEIVIQFDCGYTTVCKETDVSPA